MSDSMNEPLRGHAGDRMAEETLEISDTKEGVDDAAIADIDLGRFHEPLAHVAVPGL